MVNKTATARTRRDSAPGRVERILGCSLRSKIRSQTSNNRISNKLAQLTIAADIHVHPGPVFRGSQTTGRALRHGNYAKTAVDVRRYIGHCKRKGPRLARALV